MSKCWKKKKNPYSGDFQTRPAAVRRDLFQHVGAGCKGHSVDHGVKDLGELGFADVFVGGVDLGVPLEAGREAHAHVEGAFGGLGDRV